MLFRLGYFKHHYCLITTTFSYKLGPFSDTKYFEQLLQKKTLYVDHVLDHFIISSYFTECKKQNEYMKPENTLANNKKLPGTNGSFVAPLLGLSKRN